MNQVLDAVELGSPLQQVRRQWLRGPGQKDEWRAVLEAVRPVTAVLLLRLRRQLPEASLDEVLKSPLAKYALHDPEEIEIALVREEIVKNEA